MGGRSQNPGTEAGDSASDLDTLYSSNGKERERRTHVATFEDEAPVDTLELSGSLPHRTIGTDDDSPIENFAKRPTKIYEFSWAQNDSTVRSILPLSELFKDIYFRQKLSYWRNFRGTLKLKIVLNGNPFYYGRMMIAWEPSRTVATEIPTLAARAEAMQLSQRMHLLADPSSSEPLEIAIPFFQQQESMNITSNNQFAEYGSLYYFPLNELRHCNGSTAPISVTTFAWLDTYEVAIPTRDAIQTPAGVDERKTPVYKIATKSAGAVAQARKIARKIEPYASAVEKSTVALAKAAMLMGFSKPEKDTGDAVVPFVTDDMANTDGLDNVKRLVADTKQGLTTDPRTLGLDGTDELDLSSIVTKESYFGTMNWTSTDSPNQRLGVILLDPMMNFFNASDDNSHQFLPMGLAALTHKYWTGTMIVRLQVVGTPFQKGRLLVQYDPEGYGTTPASTNVSYTHIVDIADSKEIEFEIGWGQSYALRNVAPPNENFFIPFDGQGQDMSNVAFGNGYLSFFVLNELIGPATITDVDLNVYVRGGDDMIFTAPSGGYVPRLTLTTPPAAYQSPAGIVDTKQRIRMGGAPVPSHLMHEYCGEQTVSFRSLMKRYNYNSTVPFSSSGSNKDKVIFNYVMPRFPKGLRIYTAAAAQNALDLVIDQTNLIFTENVATTIINLLGWCFAGTRGAVRWAIHGRLCVGNSVGGRDTLTTTIFRVGRSEASSVDKVITRSGTAGIAPDSTYDQQKFVATDRMFLRGGIPVAYSINPLVKVEVPFYSFVRYSQENRATSYSHLVSETSRTQSGTVAVNGQYVLDIDSAITSFSLDTYCAAGEDFQFLWFQCVPKLYFVQTI